jgi:uncharacterized protein
VQVLRSLVAATLLIFAASCSKPGPDIDSRIASGIEHIKAIDNHAHPPRSAGDHEYDALPVDMMQPAPLPGGLDPKNPAFNIKQTARDTSGVLDEAGIEIMLANRVAMGPGLDPARFKWVPFADALMYPCNNESLGKRDPDRKAFFDAEHKLLLRYLAETGVNELPPTLDGYLAFVTKTLERQKQQGAVAEKFEMAYLRSLSVGKPDKADADRIYSAYSHGALPPDTDYKSLQDFIFRYIAAECGRLAMPVHIHSFAGVGSFYDMAGSNPMLLEPLFNDAALRNTNFVILHGGWPWTREIQALITKANVYADFSVLGMVLSPRALSEVLRGWLEIMPGKVLYGTDSGPFDPTVGFEQTAVAASRANRTALGMALTAMLRDGQITEDRALELARMTLRDNARKLYGWK